VHRLSSVLACCVLVSACKKEQESELPICHQEVAADEADESQSGQLAPQLWFQILLKNYNGKTGLVAQPVKDCSGRQIESDLPPDQAKCLLGETPPQPLPDRPLVADDLIVAPLEDGRSLLWVKAKFYDNGEALGPVAIAEWTKRGVAVRSIGAMRAQVNRARMRLEPMGQERVLVIESDVCAKDDPKKCHREVRLVPLQGDRFLERPLVAEDGACLGPPAFALHQETEFARPDGTLRKFELTRVLDFTDGNVVMSETVVVKDRDPKEPDSPPEVFRNANVRRPLVLAKNGIVTKPGLWESMLAEHGSVALQPAAKKPDGGEQ